MQKWALIKNNQVIEITNTDPTGRFHPDFQWKEIPENLDITTEHIYSDTLGFTLPEPTVPSVPSFPTDAERIFALEDAVNALIMAGGI